LTVLENVVDSRIRLLTEVGEKIKKPCRLLMPTGKSEVI